MSGKWQELAEMTGLTYYPTPSVIGTHRGRRLTLYGEREKIRGYDQLDDPGLTRVTVDVNNQVKGRLTLMKGTVIGKFFRKFTGRGRIKIGDIAFDRRFVIADSWPSTRFAFDVFASNALRQRFVYLPTLPVFQMDVGFTSIEYEQDKFEHNIGTLHSLLNVICDLAEAVEALPARG